MFDRLDLNSSPSFIELGNVLEELTNFEDLKKKPNIQKKNQDAFELYTIMGKEFPNVLKDLENIKRELEKIKTLHSCGTMVKLE